MILAWSCVIKFKTSTLVLTCPANIRSDFTHLSGHLRIGWPYIQLIRWCLYHFQHCCQHFHRSVQLLGNKYHHPCLCNYASSHIHNIYWHYIHLYWWCLCAWRRHQQCRVGWLLGMMRVRLSLSIWCCWGSWQVDRSTTFL